MKDRQVIDFTSGLISGTMVATILNPWDRALNLSIKNHRPFLIRENFIHPYQGFAQTMFQRSMFGGLYFIIQDQMKIHLYPYLYNKLNKNESLSQLGIGLVTGSINGFSSNWLSAIKYHTWGDDKGSFHKSMSVMWKNGGYSAFTKGTIASISRDALFGTTYEFLRHLMQPEKPKHDDSKKEKKSFYKAFVPNAIAAGCATVVSSPLNYARCIIYGTPPEQKPPAIKKVLSEIWLKTKEHSPKYTGRLNFLLNRFGMGWGAGRVAVGMGLGQLIFDQVKAELSEGLKSPQKGIK